MAIFFQVLLGSLLLLLVLALIGWWAFKRWIGKKVTGYLAASEIGDPRYARPARVQLEVTTAPETTAAMDALWRRFHDLGFQSLADLIDSNGAFSLMRAAHHGQMPIALVLIQDHSEEGSARFTLFSLSDANQLHAFGDGPEPSGHTPLMHWNVQSGLDPQVALQQLQSATLNMPLRPVDLRLIRLVYERAYATRMDASLMQAPTRALIEARAMNRKPPPSSKEIDAALELNYEQWLQQIEQAVIDNYQRSSGVDAVRWERAKNWVEVVHDKLRPQDIKAKFRDEKTAEVLVDQFVVQGYAGIALYQKVIERLPGGAQRRERLGEVTRPLPAILFVPNSDQQSQSVAGAHLYSALDSEGNPVHGAVLARSSSDAKGQLAAMGMSDSKVLSEPTGHADLSNVLLDPAAAAMAAKAGTEPLAKSVLRSVFASLWLWGPPLALLIWSIHSGPPYSWGDYLIFGYAALALLIFVVLVAPMVIYNQLLRARIMGRWSSAQACLGLLQWLWLPGIGKSYLVSERCKILAARGKLSEALALWQPHEASETAETYLVALASIYDAAGATEKMIDAQRRVLALNPGKETHAIDLAMSLARHQASSGEAEQLISQVPLAGLSELGMLGYQFTRGLIAAERGQHTQAIKHYGEALKLSKQYQGNPLMLGIIAEINGFVALSFKRMGEVSRADALWNTVLPLLKLHLGARYLVARYVSG